MGGKNLLYFFDLFGVMVFAITGALAAGRKHLDLFGMVVLALVTALGGGTLRDLILGVRPVFWVHDPTYIYVAVITAVLMFWLAGILSIHIDLLQVADAFGLAVFTVVGTKAGLRHEVPGVIAVMTGVMTGVVGGMLRDILTGEIPLILRKEIYATASLFGALLYIILEQITPGNNFTPFAAVFTVLILRMLALHWHLSLPIFSVGVPDEKNHE